MFKNYSLHLLKSNKTIIGIYSFICFIVFPLLMILEGIYNAKDMANIGLHIYALLLCLGVCAVPIISHMFNYNKRSVDVYYSLPIKRKDLFLIHYFIPLLVLIIPVLITFLMGLVIIGIKSVFDFGFIVEYMLRLLSIIIAASAGYSINTFFISKCNTLIDSIIITLSINAIPFLIYSSVISFIDSFLVPTGIDVFNFIEPILYTSALYNCFKVHRFMNNMTDFILLLLMLIVFIVMSFIAYRSYINRKGEDASQITDHILTYPLVINIASLCILSLVDLINAESITLLIISLSFIFVVFAVMNFIAKRKVKITKNIVLKFVLFLSIVLVMSFVAQSTYCFNMNKALVSDYDQVEVRVIVNNFSKDKYEIYGGTYLADDKEHIDELVNLQLLAAEKFKDGTYYKDHDIYCYVDVFYNHMGETNYRNYIFDYDEVSHIITDLEVIQEE